MSSYPSYLPPKDADFNDWLLNFSTLLTAAPATYGLTAPDAVAVAAQQTAFAAAYTAATDPGTRTPVTVAAKDAARASAEAVVRPYAVRISKNGGVLNEDKVAIGVTVPATVPTPVPAPTDAPVIAIGAWTPGVLKGGYSVDGQVGKSKPFGCIGVELWASVGVAHVGDPAACTFRGTVTKSPFRLNFQPADVGKAVTLFARFTTRSGPAGVAQVGPWSAPLNTYAVWAMPPIASRRDRRQIDSALPPVNAAVLCGLELQDVSANNITVFTVIDLATGNAMPYSADWRVGGCDWVPVNDPVAGVITLQDNGGTLQVTVTWAGTSFADPNAVRVPAWSEALRGPGGEWVTGYVTTPAAP
jgi:hypothetical protein